MFRFGYNTNGLSHHRLLDALRLCAKLGYEGVALTPDVGALDLYSLDEAEVDDVRRWSDELGLELVIETGARFMLDAEHKHFPTLLEDRPEDRARRIDFYERSIELARKLGAPLVSLWSGAAPGGLTAGAVDAGGADRERLWERLVQGLSHLLEYAEERAISIAFEPEPGMFIERPADYGELVERLGPAGGGLGLCLDVGHLLVTRDLPVSAVIRDWAQRLVHVHLDDIADGVHEHRLFGTGELDLEEALSALFEVGYAGMAAVELSRDSHRGAEICALAMEHLRRAAKRVSQA